MQMKNLGSAGTNKTEPTFMPFQSNHYFLPSIHYLSVFVKAVHTCIWILHLPGTAAPFIKFSALEIILCLETFICIECNNRMYVGQNLWDAQGHIYHEYTNKNIIRENAPGKCEICKRKVKEENSCRLYISQPKKTDIYFFKGQKTQICAKAFGPILGTTNYGLSNYKGSIFLTSPNITIQNLCRDTIISGVCPL